MNGGRVERQLDVYFHKSELMLNRIRRIGEFEATTSTAKSAVKPSV